MRRIVLAMVVMGLMVALMATPAFAFHHQSIPADECAPEEAGVPAANPHARAALFERGAIHQGTQSVPIGNSEGHAPTSCPA
jgi:hypothetical protein